MKVQIDIALKPNETNATEALRDIEATYPGVHGRVVKEEKFRPAVLEFEGSAAALADMLDGEGYDEPMDTYAV